MIQDWPRLAPTVTAALQDFEWVSACCARFASLVGWHAEDATFASAACALPPCEELATEQALPGL